MAGWLKTWKTQRAARALSQHAALRLHIGCGYHLLDGWLNLDLKPKAGAFYFNAAKNFPFDDDSAQFIFAEHFIEHLSQADGMRFLSECHRVLHNGGILRLSTPDLALICQTYLDQNPHVSREDAIHRHRRITHKPEADAALFFNDKMRWWGHQFIYDKASLDTRLRAVGFEDISFHQFGESPHAPLTGLEKHADVDWMKRAECLFVEAIKTG